MNEAAGTIHYIVLWFFAAYGVYRFAKDIFLKYIYSGDDTGTDRKDNKNK
jgi:hypothetical protein